jgi:AcrR family transcriptional regulator
VTDCTGGRQEGEEGSQGASAEGSEHLSKRADARRNRAQILVAAEICFAEQGVGVPIDDIARRARVGVGTVYRHFPTKEALAEAVVVTRMEKLVDEARSVAESDDPGGAFFGFLRTLSEAGSAKRDLMDALSRAGIDVKERLYSLKDELTAAIGDLLVRAKQVGAVREDVDLADLFGLVMGTCVSVQGDTGCSQARMLSIVCDGLRSNAVATAGAPTVSS